MNAHPALSIMLAALLAGCAAAPASTENAFALPVHQLAHRLFLQAAPYSRLVLHVSAVQGAEPGDASLSMLVSFLEASCAKPGGVHLRRGEPIPAATAERLTLPELLATATAGIAPVDSDTALLHLLVYDGGDLRSRRGAGDDPHVRGDCPTVIFVDRSVLPGWFTDSVGPDAVARLLGLMLQHEAGHVLGLTRRRVEGDGAHCLRDDCLMVAQPDPTVLELLGMHLLGVVPERALCARCARDLSGDRTAASPLPRWSLVGPVARRQEDAYCVYSLPYFVCIVLSADARLDAGRVVGWFQEQAPKIRGAQVGGRVLGVRDDDPESLRRAADLLARDPDRSVRAMAKMLRAKAGEAR